jgi:hypothetical protein
MSEPRTIEEVKNDIRKSKRRGRLNLGLCNWSPLPWLQKTILLSSPRLNFQSFLAVGSLDTFSTTPTVNGLSPMLKAVPDCAMS